MRNACLCLRLTHDALDFFGVRAAAFFVDVEAVRFGVEHLHISAELLQSESAGV